MAESKFSLAEIFNDGMVIQRDKPVKVYGNAPKGRAVQAALYKAGECLHSCKGQTDDKGAFLLTLPAFEAGTGYALTLECENESITINNISFGDIWLAGGQSNMEFFLKYDRDWEKTKNLEKNENIHMFNVPQRAFEGHSTHNKGGYGYWFTDSDTDSLSYFSAPGYSFAREIQASTGIPVAIIGCNWGGSTASAWVPEEVLKKEPLTLYFKEYEEQMPEVSAEELRELSLAGWAHEDSVKHEQDFMPLLYGMNRPDQLKYIKDHAGEPQIPMGPYNLNRPSGLYHTMLSTLIPFAIKGVIWYQGESDSGNRSQIYDILMSELIKDWRYEWQDDFPFIMVQLAPFGIWLECANDAYSEVRKMQEKVTEMLDDVYLASIMDLGSYYDIHPKEKMEVGRRLSLLARGHVYGENILCDAPKAVNANFDGKTITVNLKNADGLTINGESDIYITCADDRVRPVRVEVKDEKLILTPPAGFTTPDGVEAATDDYSVINIHNAAGLCLMPFQIKI